MSNDLKDLASDLKKKVEEINNAKSLVQDILPTFENEKEEHSKMVEMMKVFTINDSDIVKFNVGGKIFSTLGVSINKRIRRMESDDPNDFYEPNLLQGLTSGLVDVKRDENKAIFIDRDPKYFQRILNYLRKVNTDEDFDLPENNFELQSLLKEASFFRIQGLLDLAMNRSSLNTKILTANSNLQNLWNYVACTVIVIPDYFTEALEMDLRLAFFIQNVTAYPRR
jgi:hypothetical protein